MPPEPPPPPPLRPRDEDYEPRAVPVGLEITYGLALLVAVLAGVLLGTWMMS